MDARQSEAESIRPGMIDRRQDTESVAVVEHGIRIQADYGYVRAVKYMLENGVKWGVIQRVLKSHMLRRKVKKDDEGMLL